MRFPLMDKIESLYRSNILAFDFYQFITCRKYYDPKADVCIDGFPRSANSFAVNLVRVAKPDLKIIHHVHSPVIIRKSLSDDIPIFILIREPKDAVVSEYIRSKFSREKQNVNKIIKRYSDYYEYVAKFIEDVFIISFVTVTQSPTKYLQFIFKELNIPIEFNLTNIVNKTKSIGRSTVTKKNIYTTSMPTRERDIYKKDIRKKISNHNDFSKAEKIYQELITYKI
ncbi:MAG: hypothetical protein ACTSW1_11750 [Candidatus Hodarchaeales archaeon]